MNKYIATIILIIVSILFFITYPFNDIFWVRLANSVFCAAMIGGFADWFGVSALFRKPLGIPFKTEIIPRNREKIFNALSDMVGDELITKDKLNEIISSNSVSVLLIKYLNKGEEKKQVKEVVVKILEDIIWKLNPDEAGKLIEGIVKDNISNVKISNIIAAAIELSLKKGYDSKLIDFIVDELIKLVKTGQVNQMITSLVEETFHSYENGMKRRAFANAVVFDMFLQLSPNDIASIIQNKLVDYLYDFDNPTSDNREKFIRWINVKIVELRSNSELQEKIEHWKLEQINNNLEIHDKISSFIKKFREDNAGDSLAVTNLTKQADEQVNKYIDEFQVNLQWQSKLDSKVKGVLLQFVDNNHSKIGIMVKENLNKFTNDMLVELIETKVGNDLQIIRINGSVVGGLVGLIIFVLTFWIK